MTDVPALTDRIVTVEGRPQAGRIDPGIVRGLEQGRVVDLPFFGFELAKDEQAFLDPRTSDGRSKNVGFDPASGRLSGCGLEGPGREAVAELMRRFSAWSLDLVETLCPSYAGRLALGRTSLRPVEVSNRRQPAVLDDRRLHVDSFPSRPVQGRRILRVFANVHPSGRPRVWNVGEPFEDFARRFLPRAGFPLPGSAWALQAIGMTRGRRTPYDHLMLRMHDLAKRDQRYQASAPRQRAEFLPGGAWLVYTDAVPHAALAGQHVLEQTFLPEVGIMQEPALSPLKVLERLTGRELVPSA